VRIDTGPTRREDGLRIGRLIFGALMISPLDILLVLIHRHRRLVGTSSVQPQHCATLLAQIGRLAKKVKGLVKQFCLALAGPAPSQQGELTR